MNSLHNLLFNPQMICTCCLDEATHWIGLDDDQKHYCKKHFESLHQPKYRMWGGPGPMSYPKDYKYRSKRK